jgi:hypothetical protein
MRAIFLPSFQGCITPFKPPKWKNESILGNIFTVPSAVVSNALAWTIAQAQGDLEGKMDSIIQLFGAPISIVSQLFDLILRVSQISSLLNATNTPLLSSPFYKPMAYTSLVVSGIESIRNGLGIYRQLSFLHQINKRRHTKTHLIEFLYEHYFSITTQEKKEIDSFVEESFPDLPPYAKYERKEQIKEKMRTTKMMALSRRVSPWLVKEISESLSMNHYEISIDTLNEWSKHLDLQARKILIVHSIALATIALLVASIILTLISASSTLIFALTILSTFFSTFNYFFEYGFVESRGWNFSLINCIPDWIKWVLQKIFNAELHFEPGAPFPQLSAPTIHIKAV